MSVDATYFRDLVSSAVAGRPWLVAGDVLVPMAFIAQTLHELGASSVLALGVSRGMGDLPDPDVIPQVHGPGIVAPDTMTGIRMAGEVLADLPPDLRAAVEAFDPRKEARAVTPLYFDGRPVAGRSVLGARPQAWRDLEDKIIIDAFWDAAGIPRSPSRIVAPAAGELEAAFDALDVHGLGVVLAADARDGFHGAAHGVRWMRERSMAGELAAHFAASADLVRVMPFLEGIPCSIHGIVLPDGTRAVRPCEMVVLRKPGKAELHYAQAATFWDPADADREAMRDLARRTGEHLRRTVGYRGVFTVDGVMTVHGFRPTELNPRYGAAISILSKGLPELPLYLLHLLIADGADLDWRGDDLERVLLASGDANRQGSGSVVTKREFTETHRRSLVHDGVWRWAEDGEEAHATFTIGPNPAGGYGKVILVPEHTPVGPSVAPRIADALMFVDREFDLGLGPLEPAKAVR